MMIGKPNIEFMKVIPLANGDLQYATVQKNIYGGDYKEHYFTAKVGFVTHAIQLFSLDGGLSGFKNKVIKQPEFLATLTAFIPRNIVYFAKTFAISYEAISKDNEIELINLSCLGYLKFNRNYTAIKIEAGYERCQ